MTASGNNSPELKQAATAGQIDEVRRLLGDGADVNSVGEYGAGTLLTRSREVMDCLLGHGADPNAQQNEIGLSVLAGVVYWAEPQLVDLLIQHGADPNRADTVTGIGALHRAVTRNTPAHREIVDMLLEAGADPNAATKPGEIDFGYDTPVRTRGETPLHLAAIRAGSATIDALLRHGAERTGQDANGDTPAAWAGLAGRPHEICQLLTTDAMRAESRSVFWSRPKRAR